MLSPTFDTSLRPPRLTVVRRVQPFSPTDDIYIENPFGAIRGLGFALAFNLVLVSIGLAAWEVWQLLR